MARQQVSTTAEYTGFFTLHARDQAKSNWVLFRETRSAPKKNPQLPPVFYKFFGNPVASGGLLLRDRYQSIRCTSCGGLSPDDAFELGFDRDVKIRITGDFGDSREEVFLINKKMLNVLRSQKVGGFEVKPVGTDGWFALKVTLLVEANPKVITATGKKCAACGRPEEAFGVYHRLSDVEVPSKGNTFFSPKPMRCKPHGQYDNRDVMITGDVVTALKRSGIKGDSCAKLLTDEECKQQKARAKNGDFSFLPGTVILMY